MTPQQQTVRIDVGHLDVRVWEPGSTTTAADPLPTVVALHGFPETAWEWRPVAELLSREGIRVVAPLQRGYSRRARPAEVGAYGIENLAADVLSVANELAPGPIHLLGHDWGASVAWWLAAHEPGRVATLTAVSVPHLGAFADALASDPDQQERSACFRLFRQPGKAEDVLLADGARRLRALFGGEVPEELVETHLDVVGDREGLTGALNWYRAMRRYELPDVVVPTTFVWGEEDMAIGRSGAVATAGRVRADYRFVPVPDGGHWLPELQPEMIAREVAARIR